MGALFDETFVPWCLDWWRLLTALGPSLYYIENIDFALSRCIWLGTRYSKPSHFPYICVVGGTLNRTSP